MYFCKCVFFCSNVFDVNPISPADMIKQIVSSVASTSQSKPPPTQNKKETPPDDDDDLDLDLDGMNIDDNIDTSVSNFIK